MSIDLSAERISDPFDEPTRKSVASLVKSLMKAEDGDIVGIEFAASMAAGQNLELGTPSHVWRRVLCDGENGVKAETLRNLSEAAFSQLAPAILRIQISGFEDELAHICAGLDNEDQPWTNLEITVLAGAIIVARSNWTAHSLEFDEDDDNHSDDAESHVAVVIPASASNHEELQRRTEIESVERFINLIQECDPDDGLEFRVIA